MSRRCKSDLSFKFTLLSRSNYQRPSCVNILIEREGDEQEKTWDLSALNIGDNNVDSNSVFEIKNLSTNIISNTQILIQCNMVVQFSVTKITIYNTINTMYCVNCPTFWKHILICDGVRKAYLATNSFLTTFTMVNILTTQNKYDIYNQTMQH